MPFSKTIKNQVKLLVDHYKVHHETFLNNAKALEGHFAGDARMRKLMHSVLYRVKDPTHLEDKLFRKIKENNGVLRYTKANLFKKINDLAGVRILHLHTSQIKSLRELIEEILNEQRYRIISGPTAHTWDDESKAYFKSLEIKTQPRASLYTSIHYVLKTNTTTPYTCELQVRTLMEEVWGEVSHKINYPHETLSIACQEQIKTLARVTSAGSRLVDSLFASHAEFTQLKAAAQKAKKKL